MSLHSDAQHKSFYEKLVEINAQMDNHQSDLYVRATPDVIALIREAQQEDSSIMASFFIDEITGDRWVDLPFQYQPYWDSRPPAKPAP